jgi:negative regulator of replication initiation
MSDRPMIDRIASLEANVASHERTIAEMAQQILRLVLIIDPSMDKTSSSSAKNQPGAAGGLQKCSDTATNTNESGAAR